MRPGTWERAERRRHLERQARRACAGREKIVSIAREAEELLGTRTSVDEARSRSKTIAFGIRYGSARLLVDGVEIADLGGLGWPPPAPLEVEEACSFAPPEKSPRKGK